MGETGTEQPTTGKALSSAQRLGFFFGAVIGRGNRVFLVAWAIRLGGARAEAMLRRHIEPIGWIALTLLAVAVGWLVFAGGRP